MSIINIEHLSKSFGSKKVIDDLSLCIPEHTIFGFLGQNGAGKTTTMKMILGLLKSDSGSITVCNETVLYGQTETNRYLGYLPDVPAFYGYMRPHEYLKLCGEITGLSDKDIKTKSSELLNLVGLEKESKKIGGFSRGMKQRLGIAQALLNEPRILICDEPTSALDPIGRKEILHILAAVKGKTTVVFSTHILSDIERICDHIAVLHNGSLALSGTLSEIKASHKHDGLSIEFATNAEKQHFISAPSIASLLTHTEMTESSIIIKSPDVPATESLVISTLFKMQLLPTKLEILEPTLESLFMEVTK